MNQRALTVAVYARISLDRSDGEGVERQLADCRQLADERGWQVAEYVDNDISAYRRMKRPSWDRLLTDLRAGLVDAVCAYHPDRLYRRLQDLEELIDAIEQNKAKVATVKAGDVDLTTATGRMQARIIAAVARHESERIGERVSRAKQERAAQGRPAGGGRRPFGLTPDRLNLDRREANALRRVAQLVVGGASWTSVVRDMNEAGPRQTGGGYWTVGTLRRTLTSPYVTGLRTYKGEIVGDAVWPPIIDRDTFALLKVRCGPTRGRPPSDNHLLTGLLRCGRCGGRLFGATRKRKDRSYRAYCCPVANRGCSLTIAADPLEKHVIDTVEGWLAEPEAAAAVDHARGTDGPSEIPTVDLGDVERRLNVLSARWANAELSDDEYDAARAVLARRRREAEAAIVAAVPAAPQMSPDELLRHWRTLETADRRDTIASLVQCPMIVEAAAGRRDPAARVKILPA